MTKLSDTKLLEKAGFDSYYIESMETFARDLGVSISFVITRLSLAHLVEMYLSGETTNKAWLEFIPGLSPVSFFKMWRDNKERQSKDNIEVETKRLQTNTEAEAIRREHNIPAPSLSDFKHEA